MRRIILAIGVAVLGVGACDGAAAQATTPSATPSTAAAPALKAHRRKHLRSPRPKRIVPPGVTGGTPQASGRTPGGPPPGTPNGITIPIPSLKK
jgi:hypothetical protein